MEKSPARLNWKIYELYVSSQLPACLQLIESQLYSCRGQCEFAIFVKGLIERNAGNISESLELFQASTALAPRSSKASNLKQVARSLYLLGRYEAAISIYSKAQAMQAADGEEDDWEIWHNLGLCFERLSRWSDCIDAYATANSVQQHDSTFMRLARVYVKRREFAQAVETFKEALEFSPESPLLLTSLGLLYLRTGDHFNAFTTLGSSLSLEPTNPTTILAAGSIIQNNQDIEVALVKYRVAALQSPNSSQLWNNIGMCFYSKRKCVESVSALRRAIYLDPFDWAILYNLGLVYMATANYASAFHQFSAAINLNSRFALLFLYLAVALSFLDDPDNAEIALARALQLEASDIEKALIRINFAVVLLRRAGEEHRELFGAAKAFRFKDAAVPAFETGDAEEDEYHSYVFEQLTQHKAEALSHWLAFQQLWQSLDVEAKNAELGHLAKQQALLETVFAS